MDVYLFDTVQLLKPWNQIGHLHPHFLLHIDFLMVLAFVVRVIGC